MRTRRLTRQVRFVGVLCGTVVSKLNAESFLDTTYCLTSFVGGLHDFSISNGILNKWRGPTAPEAGIAAQLVTRQTEVLKDSRKVSTSWASATTGAFGAPSAMANILELRSGKSCSREDC